MDVNDASMAANMHLKIVGKSPQESLKKRSFFDEIVLKTTFRQTGWLQKLAKGHQVKKKVGGHTRYLSFFENFGRQVEGQKSIISSKIDFKSRLE